MISTLTPDRVNRKDRFADLVSSFLAQPGLPLAEVLDGRAIESVFASHDGLFASDSIYSTPVVLWAFLAQVLRDGKGAACAAAVADIATYLHQTGQAVPCGDTGDYCRARAKLNLGALRELVSQVGRQLESRATDHWLWQGRHAKLVDGFTFTMPDTPANQRAYPQAATQAPGVGDPIARACVILSLATAGICDVAVGPYAGKQTGETALLRRMMDSLDDDDVVVFDRYYSSYMMVGLLTGRGFDVCSRLHHLRQTDFTQAQRLDDDDYLVTWDRPARPAWMTEPEYQQMPEQLTVRQITLTVTDPTSRVSDLHIVTTLTDPTVYSKAAIAELYNYRWNVELDIRDIKQTLHLDHARCKSPAMVQRELTVTLLAYNLIRTVIATAAAVHDKRARQVGFTLACQTLLSSWMLYATGHCHNPASLARHALARIAANEVANRPGRVEPRKIKRRRSRYKLMQQPRHVERSKLLNSQATET